MASALYERRKSLPGWMRRGIFRGVRAIESAAAYRFDGIITADPGVYELFGATPDERKLICFNSALLKQFPTNFPSLAERKYDLVLLGSMSSIRSGAHNVIDALSLLKEEGMPVRLLLIGQPEGEMVDAIKERIERYGLKQYVDCTGLIFHSEVPRVLAQARIGIVSLLDYPKFHLNIACKAFEYMACGMPTIASDLPPQRLFLNDEMGIFYPPGDVHALAAAIRTLLMDCKRACQMGKLARVAVEECWNGEKEQEKLKEFYSRIIDLPPRGGK
jgi:glycosyltransferase involved in cell wall biosynthesis